MSKEICIVEGCNNKRHTKDGYCNKHHTQIRIHGRLTPELEREKRKGICSIDGCEKEIYAKTLCRYHWNKQRVEILKDKNKLGETINISICKVRNCNDIVLAKGYCTRHYNQYLRYGEITKIERRIEYPKICQVKGCNEKSYCCGYCQKHYTKWYNHGDPLYIDKPKHCNIDNCNRKYYAKGYCRKHYLEFIMKSKEQKFKEI